MRHALLILSLLLCCACSGRQPLQAPLPVPEKSRPLTSLRLEEAALQPAERVTTLFYYPQQIPAPKALIQRYLPSGAVGGTPDGSWPVLPGLTAGLRLQQTETSCYDAGEHHLSRHRVTEDTPPLLETEDVWYTDTGLPLREQEVAAGDGVLTEIRNSVYGPDGLLLREEFHSEVSGRYPSSRVREYTGWAYDSAGRLTRRMVLADGKPFRLQKFAYDLEGRLCRLTELDLEPSPPPYEGDPHFGLRPAGPAEHRRNDFDVETLFARDQAGRLTEMQIRYGFIPDPEADALFYAACGSPEKAVLHPSLRQDSHAPAQAVVSRKLFFHDDHGRRVRLLEFSDTSPTGETRWLYDARGNWIRRIYRFSEEGFRVEDRLITYGDRGS